MPAMPSSRATKKPPGQQPPGRIPDEVFDQFHAPLAKLIPAAFLQRLVAYGITDKKGNFLNDTRDISVHARL
jgi:hypothetical protein